MPRVPAKEPAIEQVARETRPNRIPVSGQREILTVFGKDPAFEYRWVKDVQEGGGRILKFKRAGYELVPSEQVEVGEELVYNSPNSGSVVRHTESDGNHLYLMRIKREFYEEDRESYHRSIDDTERGVYERADGQYGQVKVDWTDGSPGA